MSVLRLRELPVLIKLGATGLLIALLMGMTSSAMHMYWHYENRDERPGLTRDDITSAYHGLNARAPLLSALERRHPEDLPDEARRALISWLNGQRIAEDYDSLDLGDKAPAEILAANCLECHSRRAADREPRAAAIPLDYWDDVKKLAFSRQINPAPRKIIAMSMHTHALGLGMLSLVLAGLVLMSSLPRPLTHGLVALTGIALVADFAAWWAARSIEAMSMVIVGAGAAYNGGTALLMLLLLLDLWLPRRGPARGTR